MNQTLSPEKQLYELLQQTTQTMQRLLAHANANQGQIDDKNHQTLTQQIQQIQELAQVTRNEEPFMHDFYYFVELLVEEVINTRRTPALAMTVFNTIFGKELEILMSLLREMVARNTEAKAVLERAPKRQEFVVPNDQQQQKQVVEAMKNKYKKAEDEVELANQESMKLARRLQLRIKEKRGLDQPPPSDPYEVTLRTFALGAAATLVAEELELASSLYLQSRI